MYLNTRPRDSIIRIEQSNEKINVSLTFLPRSCILFCTSLYTLLCVCVCVCRTLKPVSRRLLLLSPPL